MCTKRITEASQNVQSIRRIPTRLLPNGEARDYLTGIARDGYDCYAYQPAQHPDTPQEERRYNIWINGRRHDITEWLAEFNKD
jgi:hypothetical protein